MAKGLSVSDVVRVTVYLQPKASQRRNFGIHLILGASPVIDQDERIRFYSGIDGVISDFGVTANETKAAQLFYSQKPQPSTLAIGRWVREHAPARLKGGILETASKIITGAAGWNAITDGAFDIIVNGSVQQIRGMDFSIETNLNGAARVISEQLQPSANCLWDGERFVLETNLIGNAATIGYATAPGDGSGVDISAKAGLDVDSALTPIAGLNSEPALRAVANLLDISADWYGLLHAEQHDVATLTDIAALIEAQDQSMARVHGITDTDQRALESTWQQDVAAMLKPLGFNRTFVQVSKNPHAAVSAFARASTVNFSASNSTITLKFKQEPGVAYETLRKSQAVALTDKNANVFVLYQNDSAILQEGVMSGGAFFDEIHGLDWLQNAIQNAVWNLAYQSKKTGQTDDDMNLVVNVIEDCLKEAVRNGLVAPGQWNADGFGQLQRGDYLPKGYYIFCPPVADQDQSEREKRKSVPVQVALKLKGAVHFFDVAINVNR